MNHHKPYEPKDAAGKLAKGFLRNPLTSVLGVFLLVIGYIALMVMPREENPQMVVSGSTVIVALPGSSAKEVEKIIVKPLERKLKEVKGVEHIYGMAMDNVGIVNVAFYIGEKKEDSNLKVYDKIMQNSDMFPKGAMNPIIKPLDIEVFLTIGDGGNQQDYLDTVAKLVVGAQPPDEVDVFREVELECRENLVAVVEREVASGGHVQ